MNKLKLIYDVVKTMKEKEVIQGTLQVEGKKNELQFFSLANEFVKNFQTGETKAKISTQLDYNGNKVKHESQIEFNSQGGNGRMCHGLRGHMHHHGHGGGHKLEGFHHAGFKQKLNRLAFGLHVLNQIKLTEQDDKSIILTFDTDGIPDEIRQACQEKMKWHQTQHPQVNHGQGGQQHLHCFANELVNIQDPVIGLAVRINPNNEVEKITVCVAAQQAADGQEQIAGGQAQTALNVNAELNLIW